MSWPTDREPLPTIDAVRDHLRRHRADLRDSVVGFSGGKEAVALATLVREVDPSVPLWYCWAGECEWPEHLGYILGFGGVRLVEGPISGYGWFAAHPWAFLPRQGSKESDRLSRTWHRDPLRRLAREEGKILLWGNRLKDGNNVPAVRFLGRGTRLWMPLRDLPTDAIAGLVPPARLSPIYRHPTGRKSDVAPTRHVRPRLGIAAEMIREDARRFLPADRFAAWDRLYREVVPPC